MLAVSIAAPSGPRNPRASRAWVLVLAAILLASHLAAAHARNEAVGDIKLSVSKAGNDEGDCITSACLTIQRALSTLQNDHDLRGRNAEIHVDCTGGTTYADPVKIDGIFPGQTSTASIKLIGDNENPSNCLVTAPGKAFSFTRGAALQIEGFSVSGVATSFHAHAGGSEIYLSNIVFRRSDIHVLAHVGAIIQIVGDCWIDEGGKYFIDAAGTGAWVKILPEKADGSRLTITTRNTPEFEIFAMAIEGGLVNPSGPLWQGTGIAGKPGLQSGTGFGGIVYPDPTMPGKPAAPGN